MLRILRSYFRRKQKNFQFVVENESREKEYKVDIQSIRLLGPCVDQLKDVCVQGAEGHDRDDS